MQLQKISPNTRRLIYLQERIEYVEVAYNRLSEREKKIYKYIFKERCNWLYCQTMYNVSRKAYYNVYNKALIFLAEEWGEI